LKLLSKKNNLVIIRLMLNRVMRIFMKP